MWPDLDKKNLGVLPGLGTNKTGPTATRENVAWPGQKSKSALAYIGRKRAPGKDRQWYELSRWPGLGRNLKSRKPENGLSWTESGLVRKWPGLDKKFFYLAGRESGLTKLQGKKVGAWQGLWMARTDFEQNMTYPREKNSARPKQKTACTEQKVAWLGQKAVYSGTKKGLTWAENRLASVGFGLIWTECGWPGKK